MKPYRILKDFNGSQTGIDFHSFEAGTVANLSDSLAEVVLKEGLVEPVAADGKKSSPQAASRETKVIAPAETKPVTPAETPKEPAPAETKPDLAKMSYKELGELAKSKGITVKVGTSTKALIELLSA
jgi:hypothetical protein